MLTRRLLLALLVGAWIALLTLPLNVRTEKQDTDVATIEPHLARSLWIGLGVAAAGVVGAIANELRKSRSGMAIGARARDAGDAFSGWFHGHRGLPTGLALTVLAAAAGLPLLGNDYYVSVGTITAIYACLALGLNIAVGQAGLLVLGYAAFYAAGAYSYAILHQRFQLSFWVALPIGAVVAALLGLALGAPTLRLRGDYLAIVTLGFGEMMRIVLINADDLTNGANGISGMGRPVLPLLGEASDQVFYWLTLVLVVAAAAINDRLNRSRLGRAWMAMREDEIAARAMGINITWMRLLAFSLSAMWAGICGVFFAAKQSFVSPENFTFMESVTMLAMVILGGMGSIPGVITGAVVLGLLPEVLRGVSEYRMITLAGLMIVMMIFRPQGLFPDLRRKLELHEEPPAR